MGKRSKLSPDESRDVDTSLSLYRAFLSILSIIAGFVFAFISSQLFLLDSLNERQIWTIRFMVASLGFFLLVIVLYQSANKEMVRQKTNIMKLYGKWSRTAIRLGSYFTSIAILCLCIAVASLLYYQGLILSLVIWITLVTPTTIIGFYMTMTFVPRND